MTTSTFIVPTNRPYPPPSNVITLLHRLRTRNVPERIDTEFLRDIGISEGTINRAMFALRFLGLIDGDEPSAALRAIAVSTDEEYQGILSGLLRDAYREVFEAVDPAEDTHDRIANVFRRYTPGSQKPRMVVFFLGMCREAGIPTLDGPRLRTSHATPSTKLPRPTPRGARRDGVSGTKPARRPLGNGTGAAGMIPPALELLVRSLPPIGTPLPPSQREQWLRMARETLAFIYPHRAMVVAAQIGDEDAEDAEADEHDEDDEEA